MTTMRDKVLRPQVIVPLVVIVAGAAIWLGFKSGNSSASTNTPTATKQLYTVAPTTMDQTVSASGTIAPADTEDLNFAVAGTVQTVNVKAGQTVKKGQVLATVGSAALLNAVAQAKATLSASQATLSDDENSSASSAQIANDQAEVAVNYASLLTATGDLNGATLTSPIAGTVATVNLTVGDVLNSSGSSGTDVSGTGTGSGRNTAPASSNSNAASTSSSANSSSTQIEVISTAYVVNLSVDTTTLGNLKVGQSATVTPTSSSSTSSTSGRGFGGFGGGGFGSPFAAAGNGGTQSTTGAATATGSAATGKVTSVGSIASSSSGVATFPVVISVSGGSTGFHAGASASTVVTYKSLPNVLAVPTLAVTVANGESTVTVATNGAADGSTQKRVVTTGITSGGQIQITSGLQAGDQVVITVPARRATTGSGRTGAGGGTQFPGGGEFPSGAFGGAGGGKP